MSEQKEPFRVAWYRLSRKSKTTAIAGMVVTLFVIPLGVLVFFDWLSALLALLGLIGIAVPVFESFVHNEITWGKWIVGPATILLLTCGNIKQYRDSASSKARHDLEMAERDKDRKQLANLNERVAPLREIIEKNNLGPDEKESFKKLASEWGKWTHPQLVFVKNKTQQETVTKKEEKGHYKTTYFFRSQYPVALRDVTVKMRFDCSVVDGHGGLLSSLNYPGNFEIVRDPDEHPVKVAIRTLSDGADLVFAVFTMVPPNIVSLETSP